MHAETDLTPQLQARTYDLLINRARTLTIEKISEATGISASWLAKFSTGNVKDPSVNTVETLYVFLTGTPLSLDS